MAAIDAAPAPGASPLRLLAIAGSARAGSLNVRLLAAAVREARDAGAKAETLDLRALGLPVYDGDLEAASGVPDGARRLRDAVVASDALLVATPEYNGFPPPLLTNAFDWLSRLKGEGGAPAGLEATAMKPVALMSASPGALGGLRALNTLRAYLQMGFQMIVVPRQHALSRAASAFDSDGRLVEDANREALQAVVRQLTRVAGSLREGAR